ncbi:MAG: hypothetical protein R2748_12065 [Bryobacterales bacterium]
MFDVDGDHAPVADLVEELAKKAELPSVSVQDIGLHPRGLLHGDEIAGVFGR